MTEVLSVYVKDYPGFYEMLRHDEEIALRRWFDNYRVNKYECFANHYEWLTIEEVMFTVGRKTLVRYEGEIGEDGSERRRKVTFDVGAPPPPSFIRPAKEKRPPPPPRSVSGEAMFMSEQRFLKDIVYGRRALSSPYHYNFVSVIGVDMGRPEQEVRAPAPEPRYRRN